MLSFHLAGATYESMVDGQGMRATIFTSGCPHHCPGCHNAQAQNPEFGTLVTDELINSINIEIDKRPFLSGLTLSGGDPFMYPQSTWLLLERLHIPNNNLWVYTGYTWEELLDCSDPFVGQILNAASVLVDGLFIQCLADKRLKFRGSANQRIVDVKRSLETSEVVLYDC